MRRALWAALVAVLLLLLSQGLATAEQTIEVKPGELYPLDPLGAVRYRNFNSSTAPAEVYLGRWELLEGGRNQIDFASSPPCDGSSRIGIEAWEVPGLNHVSFSYADGWMTTEVQAKLYDYCLVYPLQNPGALSLNHIQIDVWRQAPETTVVFENVRLCTPEHPEPECFDLPDFVGLDQSLWHVVVSGTDLSAGFTLDGDIYLSGNQPDASTYEANKVELQLGHYYAPDNEEGPPVTGVEAALLGCNAEVVATADDSATGNSDIAYAEYTVNPKLEDPCYPPDRARWVRMDAQDGAYDSPVEVVTATFDASQPGLYCVCVQATDVKKKEGLPTCATLTVPYAFTGFFEPIDMAAVNVARAGQTIPVRWRITNCKGAPISDPTSFAGLYSYPIACQELTGDPVDPVEEYSTGSTGLKYLKDGRWQYNWKTPKSYAGRCHRMYVLFKNGTTSPMADFSFR